MLLLLVACGVQDTDSEGDCRVDTCGAVIDGDDEDADGYSTGDCDSSNPDINPGATEVCDDVDNNCDGTVDENLTDLYFKDADNDGFGNDAEFYDGCDPGTGWTTVSFDCDDTDPAVNPDAEESCNAVDDDCDGDVDELLGATWYRDADGDGYGDPETPTSDCGTPDGYVLDHTDCDDGDATAHPGGTEACGNGVDDDCDGIVDADC